MITINVVALMSIVFISQIVGGSIFFSIYIDEYSKKIKQLKETNKRMEEILTAKQKQLLHEREKVKGCVILRKDQYKQLVKDRA